MNPRKKVQYRQAVRLRFQGKSYGEISKELAVAKSTVSQWCKHLKLPAEAQRILKKKEGAGLVALAQYGRQRSIDIKQENHKIVESALREIKALSKRELMLLGAALYWAEGYKIEKQKYPEIGFANSDPFMVALFLRFLREVMDVPNEYMRLDVRIYSGMNKNKIINFWSTLTSIPATEIKARYYVSRASKGKRPHNTLPYGTLRLQVRGRKNAYRIKGWIDALKNQSDFEEDSDCLNPSKELVASRKEIVSGKGNVLMTLKDLRES